jgi:signal transduction histidine kinase
VTRGGGPHHKASAALAQELARLRRRVSALELERAELLHSRGEIEAARSDFQDLYDIGPLPAVSIDRGQTIRRLNHAAAELIGEPMEKLTFRSFRPYVVPEDRPFFSQFLTRAAERGTTETCRLRLCPNGDSSVFVQIWIRFSNVTRVFELWIVDLRELEDALEETRRLSDLERSAREESAAKDRFIAVLSHELRAPLTPVLAAASAFKERQFPAELHDVFCMIERNIGAEARLIDDLLDVNRIIRSKMRVECKPGDVHEIALEAVELLRMDATAKQQEIELRLQAERHHATIDAARLRQVFVNLLKNAIKFTPPGGHIRVTSWNAQGTVCVEVDDDGMGLDPDKIDRLFEPFTEESISPKGGLGLGLAISKGLVELQGGTIGASSRGHGTGSRFVVKFPVVAPAADYESEPPKRRTMPPPPSCDRKPCILLVEDHSDTAEVLSELLVSSGYDVETASSLEAARKVDLEHVDVIVSDLSLPDGTGLDLMREFREHHRQPAIALSGFGMQADQRASRDAGFDVHLTKPVSIERLLEAIQQLNPRLPPGLDAPGG